MNSFVNIPSINSNSWKEPVATIASLPSGGNNIGDARVVKDNGSIYIWDSSQWVPVTGGGASGVSSLNSATGALTIEAGTNVTIDTVGDTITVNATGGGGGGISDISSPIIEVTGTTSVSLNYKPVNYVNQDSLTGAATVDCSIAPSHWIDLGSDCEVTVINAQQGGSYIIAVAQNFQPQNLSFSNTVYWGPQGAPNIIGMEHDAWIVINLWVDYYDRLVGSYYMNYGP